MNPKSLIVMLVLFLLVGCVHSRSAGSRGSEQPRPDFDALVSNAKADLAPRTLPNGKLYCAELARAELAQDKCAGDLEDTLLASETDKAVGLANLVLGIERIRAALDPCRWFEFRCKSRVRKLDRRSSSTNGN